ncbi:MAG TPA: hypothetical protein VFS34_02925, partial [Thermoanaerobaculia bacterium]|nr:hypothetical protein [Thermoanaerobaculia bacterium]
MREETETPPDPVVRSERSRRTVAALALVFAWGVVFRAALVPRPRPGRFWDTESYVRYARQWASGGLPHLDARTPGYPLLLLAAGTPIPRARRVVRAQRGLGVACGGLVFVLVLAMTRRRSSATAAGLAAPLLLDLTFMELVIYSETLGTMLALAAVTGLAFAAEARRG